MADLSPVANSIQLLSGDMEFRTAGASVTAGQPVYVDASDSDKVKPADSNAAGKTTVRGIALDSGSTDESVRVALDGARINLGVSLGIATIYVLSENVGAIAPSTDLSNGETLSILGAGETAAIFVINIWNSGIVKA